MIIQVVVVAEKQVSTQVAKLINRVKQSIHETQQQAINLIETIILYNLPTLSQEELQAMLGIEDLKKPFCSKNDR